MVLIVVLSNYDKTLYLKTKLTITEIKLMAITLLMTKMSIRLDKITQKLMCKKSRRLWSWPDLSLISKPQIELKL